jgi:hypothetical protein
LIIGEDLSKIYPQINEIYPDAQFYITSKSKDILNSFMELYNEQQNYSTHILDVFEGVSLHDFTYYNGKFDLIIANKIYSQAKKKIGYYSINFLFKHYLRQYGILCLIFYIENTKGDKFSLLKNIKPIFRKKISIRNKKGSIFFIFYIRRKKIFMIWSD